MGYMYVEALAAQQGYIEVPRREARLIGRILDISVYCETKSYLISQCEIVVYPS